MTNTHAALSNCGDLMVCFISSGLVLAVRRPVLAGGRVVLVPKPPSRSAAMLKSTAAVSHDKTCHMSPPRHLAPPTTDTNTLHTCHERSHHKADELRFSRLPSWRKTLAVQAEETALPPSEDHKERYSSTCPHTAQVASLFLAESSFWRGNSSNTVSHACCCEAGVTIRKGSSNTSLCNPICRSRLSGPTHTWVWFKDHLLLADFPTLALTVSDVTVSHRAVWLTVTLSVTHTLLSGHDTDSDRLCVPRLNVSALHILSVCWDSMLYALFVVTA